VEIFGVERYPAKQIFGKRERMKGFPNLSRKWHERRDVERGAKKRRQNMRFHAEYFFRAEIVSRGHQSRSGLVRKRLGGFE
jgi:hypothetical protein